MSVRSLHVGLFALAFSATCCLLALAEEKVDVNWKSSLDHNYRKTYQYYYRIYAEDKRQIRDFYINRVMASAMAGGRAIPSGAIIVMEVSGAALGADGQALRDVNGNMVLGPLNVISVMETISGASKLVPQNLANDDWVYFFFSDDFEDKTTAGDRADCLQCHKKAAASGFVFTHDAILKSVR
jgi:hypothetical protein